jgi:DNA-binding NarL/FixJ family response regulator
MAGWLSGRQTGGDRVGIDGAALVRGGGRRASPSAVAPPADESSCMHPLKTYIVEDSAVIRDNLIATLEELVPLTVLGTAEDESSAVHWLRQPGNQADLLIVDIFLRQGSGLGVLRAAADVPRPHKTVVLSNYATPDMRRRCLELGADRVFDKSNEIEALILYCKRLATGETGDSAFATLGG